MDTVRKVFGLKKTAGLVGVEIEVEGRALPPRVVGWAAHHDGSLRGENLEYVTVGAVSLEKLGADLLALQNALKLNGSVVNDAHRGSVHVHVNVQDKSIEQVFTTLFLWLLVEPLWMRLCGPTRDGNLFCMTSSSSGDIVQYAKEMLLKHRHKMYYAWPQRGKYASLNTDCLLNFGSLEFRTFPSSVDPKKVKDWATWSAKLVEIGTNINPDKMADVWNKALREPNVFFHSIFGNDALRDIGYGDLFMITEEGAENAADMLLVWAQHKKAAEELLKNPPPQPKVDQFMVDMFGHDPFPDDPEEDDA